MTRHEIMGYGLAASYLMTTGFLAFTVGALAGHFEHDSLRTTSLELRYGASLESVVLAFLSFLYARPMYAVPALLMLAIFNPFRPFHLSFWTWQFVDWCFLALAAFCNLMFYSLAQEIAANNYVAKP